MKRACIYARFSSDNQRTESIDAQIRAIREYCVNNKITVVKIYADKAISGTSTDNREEFLKVNHYSNMRPLLAIDNLLKSNKEQNEC